MISEAVYGDSNGGLSSRPASARSTPPRSTQRGQSEIVPCPQQPVQATSRGSPLSMMGSGTPRSARGSPSHAIMAARTRYSSAAFATPRIIRTFLLLTLIACLVCSLLLMSRVSFSDTRRQQLPLLQQSRQGGSAGSSQRRSSFSLMPGLFGGLPYRLLPSPARRSSRSGLVQPRKALRRDPDRLPTGGQQQSATPAAEDSDLPPLLFGELPPHRCVLNTST